MAKKPKNLTGYEYTGKYSWTKERAKKRAEEAKKKGYSFFAKTTPKGYGWLKKEK